jgi:MOSC domain-containing protein YiiM
VKGRIHQLNISAGGVPKLPVPRSRVGTLGLEGDGHRYHGHGGPDKAVCLFALETIEKLRGEGHLIEPGAAGENVTTVGLDFGALPTGTRLGLGAQVIVELTEPAAPCRTIAHCFADRDSGRIAADRAPDDVRMYARVVREGEIAPGDPIEVLA